MLKKRMMLGVVFVLCCLVFTANMGHAADNRKGAKLLLVEDGNPVATIVIAKEANRSAQFAAAELQHHVEKITGAKLPITADEDKIKGTRILVGESNATQELGLRNKDFKHQEYLIRFLPDTLILMGRDKEDKRRMDYANSFTFPSPYRYEEQATCYAVYDFLERFCGIRWYLPTDLGLVCPKEKTLFVKGVDVRRAPAMKYREMNIAEMIPADLGDLGGPILPRREGMLFLYRQRLMGIQRFASKHAFYGYYKRYLKKHPEWFAQGYDKDMPKGASNKPMKLEWGKMDGYPTLYYPNMCYTNEGFIQQVIKRARDYFETGHKERGEDAAGDFFALAPMDSRGKDKFCQCPKCQVLLHNVPPCNQWRKQYFFWNDNASDYTYGFVNKVAKEVAKTHPGKYLTMLAYHQTYYPPTREPLEPNVAISFCIHAQLRAVPAMDRAVNDLLNKWDEESRERPKYLWLYFHQPGRANPFFPGFMAHNMVKQMKDYHKRGFRGIFAEPAYIPREERKKGWARRAPIVNMLELYIAFKLADDPTLDGNKLIDEFFTLYYGAAAKPMQTLYEKIEQVYCDPSNYSFDPYTYFGYQTKEIAWGKLGTKERMAEFGKLMEEAKNAAKTEIEKKRVALFEKSVWKRMKAGSEEYLSVVTSEEYLKIKAQKKNALKSARAAWITGASPNGELNKVDWSQAGILRNWGTLNGKPTSRKLEGRLLHDGHFLYVQLQEIMDTSKLVYRDNAIWEEDDWELFFVSRKPGKSYRQIGINAKGMHKCLTYGERKKEWDSGVRVISDTSNPDRWVVRMAFPLKTILPGGVKPGQTIYMNIVRGTAGDVKKSLSWIPTFTESFHSRTQLGAVKLNDKEGINIEEKGLIGLWKFDESKGEIVKDFSGNGNDGMIHGATATVGKIGHALSFDGQDDYVDCGNDASLAVSDSLTISAWVYANGLPGGIVMKGKSGTWQNNEYGIRGTGGAWRFFICNEYKWGKPGAKMDGLTFSLPINEWVYIVAVTSKNLGKLTVYVNGEIRAQRDRTVDNIGASKSSIMSIGRGYTAGFFHGTIDEVRVYNRALTAEEIKNHYDSVQIAGRQGL